jgi:hypothetical protein
MLFIDTDTLHAYTTFAELHNFLMDDKNSNAQL